jgi:hypothetical protein
MASHIVPMICRRIVDGLIEVCITNVSFSDPTRLNAIKIGRFQEDPTVSMLRASVQGGDLEDPNLMDGIVTLKEGQNSRTGFTIEPREIGGSQMWYRRGVVRLELFFIIESLTEDVSREYAYTVLGRMQNNIEKFYVADLYDDFGEHAVKLFHTQNSMYQSGGPPTSFLWRGKLVWECLTERDWSE